MESILSENRRFHDPLITTDTSLNFTIRRHYQNSIEFTKFSEVDLPDHSLIICDPIFKLHFQKFPTLWLDSCETNKTFDGLEKIIHFLQQHQANRQSKLVAVGGGSLLDLVGFAASIYMRGINWWCVPTTLLAMVDASVGGKTAINIQNVKNLLGSFHPPLKTIIDLTFLQTLSPAQYASGMAEIIKMAWTSDASAWSTGEFQAPEDVINYAIKLKLKIINNDWFENTDRHDRIILNAGHTFGHAFERLYPHLSHGQAVALGLLAEHDLATNCTQQPHATEQLQKALSSTGLEIDYKAYLNKPDQLISLMLADKKNQAQSLQFIVAKKPGHPYRLKCIQNDIRVFVSKILS